MIRVVIPELMAVLPNPIAAVAGNREQPQHHDGHHNIPDLVPFPAGTVAMTSFDHLAQSDSERPGRLISLSRVG